jgi:hypothetical protein
MAVPTLSGKKFLVNGTLAGEQADVKVTALRNGTFLAVWRDDSETGADPDGSAIRAQIFNADGTKKGAEFIVNSTVHDDQTSPVV